MPRHRYPERRKNLLLAHIGDENRLKKRMERDDVGEKRSR